MFASQRPVPSKAALRILRQLAYISSGTVCGAAALVAEERRRQTCVARKIVDNTRRLKQHPRHARAHNHAAVASRDRDSFLSDDQEVGNARSMAHSYGHDSAEQENTKEKQAETHVLWTPDTRTRSTSARAVHGEDLSCRIRAEPDAFRNDQLPSEVDKGYRKLTKRSHVRQRSQLEDNPPRTRTPTRSHAKRTTPTRVEHPMLDAYLKPPMHSLTVSATGKESTEDSPRQDASEPPLVEGIADRVRVFLERTYLMERYHPSDAIQASRLLSTTITASMFDASRDLCYWLLETGNLNAGHIDALARQSTKMFANHDFDMVRAFYENLLFDERIHAIPSETVNHSKLLVTAATLDASHQLPIDARLPLYHSAEHSHPTLGDGQLVQCCTNLVEEGQTRAASRLLLHCIHHQNLDNHRSMVVIAGQLFNAAVDADMVSEGEMLLQIFDGDRSLLEPCLDTLYRCCVRAGAHDVFSRLHEKYATRHPFSSELYPTLFTSYAQSTDWKLVTSSIWKVERPREDAVIAACQPAWAGYLRRMARVTKNLDLVNQTFEKMSTWAGEGRVSIEVYNAIIHACVNVGQVNEAKHFLHQMQHRDGIQPNLVTFGWFVLSTAKRQDWTSVEELMTVTDTAGDIAAPSVQRTRLYNTILREYVRSHGAEDTWSFISRAIDVHGIIPDQALCDVVTESFIRHKSLDLIPYWLEYMRSRGLEGQLSTRAASNMITRYYYEFRPSHVYILELCRSLARHAPEMISEDLLLLAQDAITHDIRHLRGTNAIRLRALAEARLLSLTQAIGSVPKPIQWYGRRSEVRERTTEGDEQVDVPNEAPQVESPLSSADQTAKSDHSWTALEQPSTITPAKKDYRPRHEDWGQMQSAVCPPNGTLTSNKVPRRENMSAREQESQMLSYLSIDCPAEAVSFYKSSLAARGLRHFSISLDVAIQSSIKSQNGQTTQAEEMLADAQEAGYNITSALTPLLIHRIREAKEGDSLNVDNIRETVKKFYEEMVSNNIPIKHHVVTTAASVLLQANKPAEGASLLDAIFNSDWTLGGESFDTPAWTVWLQCYIKLAQRSGIEWVINHILRDNLRIDRGLTSTLDRAARHFKLEHAHTGHAAALELHLYTKRIHALCRHRQTQQISSAVRFGRDLVNCIIRCSRPAPAAIEAAKREEVETELLGARWDVLPGAKKREYALQNWTPSSTTAVGGDGDDETELDRALPRKGSRKAKAERPRRRAIVAGRKEQAAWKALLRRGLVDEEGRKMRFRFVDATK